MQNARRISFAPCAISFRVYSTPAAGAWRRWDRWRWNPPARGRAPSPRLKVPAGSRGPPLGPLCRDSARFGKQLLQFAALVHFDGDVAAADQIAVDIKLRERRPVGIALQRLAHFRIFEN